VVVEAVEHHIENGLHPKEATIKAMEQVSGPVIAVGLVLSAVFIPRAVIRGLTGQFFRPFAGDIAGFAVISAVPSPTLPPGLTAPQPGPDGAAAEAPRQDAGAALAPARVPSGGRLVGLGVPVARADTRPGKAGGCLAGGRDAPVAGSVVVGWCGACGRARRRG